MNNSSACEERALGLCFGDRPVKTNNTMIAFWEHKSRYEAWWCSGEGYLEVLWLFIFTSIPPISALYTNFLDWWWKWWGGKVVNMARPPWERLWVTLTLPSDKPLYDRHFLFISFNVTQRGLGRVSKGMEGGDEEATLGKHHRQWLELEFWSWIYPIGGATVIGTWLGLLHLHKYM